MLGRMASSSGGRVGPVGVGRARAVDRLHDEGIAHSFGRLPDVRHGPGGHVPGRPQPGRVQDLLHPLLVAERHRLGHRQPGQAELLAEPRGQHHVRLPQALDLVDVDLPGQVAHGAEHLVLVGQRADVHVVGQRVLGHRGQRVQALVAQADGGHPGQGQAAGEERHLGRVARRDHQHVHGQPQLDADGGDDGLERGGDRRGVAVPDGDPAVAGRSCPRTAGRAAAAGSRRPGR